MEWHISIFDNFLGELCYLSSFINRKLFAMGEGCQRGADVARNISSLFISLPTFSVRNRKPMRILNK